MMVTGLREIALAIALFFNPLGYNELFALIMSLTSSYWITASIFYCLAGMFFVVYFILRSVEKKRKDRRIIVVEK